MSHVWVAGGKAENHSAIKVYFYTLNPRSFFNPHVYTDQNSSPVNASPMGSPSSCGTNEPSSCEPYEAYSLPVVSSALVPPGYPSNPPPPTSSSVVPFHHHQPSYYPVISQAACSGAPWPPMQVPVTASGCYDNFVAGQPMPRSGSQHSLNDEAHAISIIENHPQQGQQHHAAAPIEFYADPLTPPESASPQQHVAAMCYPGQPELMFGPPSHAPPPPQCSPFANKPRGETDLLFKKEILSKKPKQNGQICST